jgi:hypothetical protein
MQLAVVTNLLIQGQAADYCIKALQLFMQRDGRSIGAQCSATLQRAATIQNGIKKVRKAPTFLSLFSVRMAWMTMALPTHVTKASEYNPTPIATWAGKLTPATPPRLLSAARPPARKKTRQKRKCDGKYYSGVRKRRLLRRNHVRLFSSCPPITRPARDEMAWPTSIKVD